MNQGILRYTLFSMQINSIFKSIISRSLPRPPFCFQLLAPVEDATWMMMRKMRYWAMAVEIGNNGLDPLQYQFSMINDRLRGRHRLPFEGAALPVLRVGIYALPNRSNNSNVVIKRL